MSRHATRAAVALACLVSVLGACSDDGGGGAADAAADARTDAAIDASSDAPTGPLTITSTAFADGETIPGAYTCNGANQSPPLAWVSTPPGTRSLAVIMTDTTVGLIQWAIYDIPPARTGLPADVDKTYTPADVPGAHQARSFNAEVTGYLGPCPPQQHTYAFELYALDAEMLPGTSEATTRVQVQALVSARVVASATLTGTYAQP